MDRVVSHPSPIVVVLQILVALNASTHDPYKRPVCIFALSIIYMFVMIPLIDIIKFSILFPVVSISACP